MVKKGDKRMVRKKVEKIENQYRPDFVPPPGETLLETLNALGLTQAKLSRRMGRPLKSVNQIVKGSKGITPETALQLERVLGVPASFWNNLETGYRDFLARKRESRLLSKSKAWLKKFPLKKMANFEWIKLHKDPILQVEEILNFFGIVSENAWGDVWTETCPAFRRARTFKSDPYALAAWMRRGEIEAKEIECSPFHEKAFREALEGIRDLTCEGDVQVFVPKLRKLASAAGVAVLFIPEIPGTNGTHVSGMARWLSKDKALIQLSLRYKSNDHLWFTFFHEVAHILLHSKKKAFLDEKITRSVVDKEREANQFAADFLIPPDEYDAFFRKNSMTTRSIREFAEDLGIAPGIVVGRLQYEGVLRYSQLNGLKQRYIWC